MRSTNDTFRVQECFTLTSSRTRRSRERRIIHYISAMINNKFYNKFFYNKPVFFVVECPASARHASMCLFCCYKFMVSYKCLFIVVPYKDLASKRLGKNTILTIFGVRSVMIKSLGKSSPTMTNRYVRSVTTAC